MNSAVILVAIAVMIVAIAVIILGIRLSAVRKELLAESIKRSKEFYEYHEQDVIRWLQLKNEVSSCQRDCYRLTMQLYEINPNVGKYIYGDEKE